MDLSNLTPSGVAALANASPEGFLKAMGAKGRPLRAGGQTKIEERHRKMVKRSDEKVLREVAAGTRVSDTQVRAIARALDEGDLSIRKLSEAVSETQLVALLRYGVQNFLFDGYAAVDVIYPDLVRMVNSSGAEELYAPLYGPELPKKVKPGQEFGDSRLEGLDEHVANDKYGRMLSVEKELVEDDKTGQIVTRAGQLGERMRYVEESVVIAAIESGGPQGYTLAIGNITPSASYGQLSQAILEAAHQSLMQITDPLGNLMLVDPNTLLFSSGDYFNAAKLMQSALQPSIPGGAGQTLSTASSGTTGFTMTMNPLQGLYDLKMSRFLPFSGGLDGTHGHAYLMEAKKSLVFQERTALQVQQEAVNAGASFERDVYRYRTDRRYAAALVESRYVYRLN